MKNIYIPWFGNTKDKIFKWYLSWDAQIIQENLRQIWIDRLFDFISKYSPSDLYLKLKKRYPWIDKDIFEWVVWRISQFRWFTIDLHTTIKFTQTKLTQVFNQQEEIRLVWHSQWWMIVILVLMKQPELLEKIKEIHLLAPVPKFQISRNFHNLWQWYLHKKWVIVRKSYINSFDRQDWDEDLIKIFLEFLNQKNYNWKVVLKFSIDDAVIDIKDYKIKEYAQYNFVSISILESWWHNLWYND